LYNRRVHPQPIKTRDLVLRKAEVSDPTCSRGKLAPSWEEPYQVTNIVRDGTDKTPGFYHRGRGDKRSLQGDRAS
ncbi:hypothetical protein BHE74_00000468, partial [Ensete ventricosum]